MRHSRSCSSLNTAQSAGASIPGAPYHWEQSCHASPRCLSSRAGARDLTSDVIVTQSTLRDCQQICEILRFAQDDTRGIIVRIEDVLWASDFCPNAYCRGRRQRHPGRLWRSASPARTHFASSYKYWTNDITTPSKL